MTDKSGSRGAALLCAGSILSKYLIAMPRFAAENSANAAWLETLFAGILFALGMAATVLLYKPLCGRTLYEAARPALGKACAEAIMYFYAAFFVLHGAALLRILTEALRSVMANGAPTEYFMIFCAVCILCAAHRGLRAAENITVIVFPLAAASVLTMAFILSGEYRIDNIMPIFGSGAKSLLRGAAVRHFGFAEAAMLFFTASGTKKYRNVKNAARLIVILTTAFGTGLISAYCLVVPYPASAGFVLPLYQMSRMIRASSFLQRMEPLVVFVWTGLILCGISATLCTAAGIVGKGEAKNPAVRAVGMIMLFAALLFKSDEGAYRFYEKILLLSPVAFPVIPLVVFIAARARRTAARGGMKCAAVCLCAAVLFSGCGYAQDADAQVFCAAIGIDKGENMPLKLTFMFENPPEGDGDAPAAQSDESAADLITLEAPSIYSAVRRMNAVKSKKINLSHTKMLVFSKEIAEEGIGEIIRGTVSAREFRPNTFVTVSRDGAGEYLHAIKPRGEAFTDKYFDGIMRKVVTDGVNEAYLYYLYFNMLEEGTGSIVPLVGVNAGGENTASAQKHTDDTTLDDYAGSIAQSAAGGAEIAGSALLAGDKLAGYMNSADTTVARMICNEYYPDSYTLTDPNGSGDVTVRIFQNKRTKIDAEIKNGKAVYTVKIAPDFEYVTPAPVDGDRFLSYVCAQIQARAEKTINETRRQYGCDFFGICEKAKKCFADLAAWQAFAREHPFSEAEINVFVEPRSVYREEVG